MAIGAKLTVWVGPGVGGDMGATVCHGLEAVLPVYLALARANNQAPSNRQAA